MGRRIRIPHLLLLAGFISAIGVPIALAAVPNTPDRVWDRDPAPASESLEMGSVRPLREARPSPVVARPQGNPLWSVPLSALTATRDRPIFSASRRPPPRAVISPVVEQAPAAAPPQEAVLEPASMQLMGAVVGDKDAIAILLDQTTREIVRMRVGEDRRGWTLSSVQSREATFRRNDQTEILVLQRSDETRGPPAAPAAVPPLMQSGVDNSFAPFTPRSTPKNGESDGL